MELTEDEGASLIQYGSRIPLAVPLHEGARAPEDSVPARLWILRERPDHPGLGKLAIGAYTGDYPPPEPITIMEDNTAAIALAKSKGARHSRAKHIELKWFWVRTMVQAGIVLPVYCPTK